MISAEVNWQENDNILCSYEQEVVYNTKLSIIEVLEEKARREQEVTEIIRFSYISDTDERE